MKPILFLTAFFATSFVKAQTIVTRSIYASELNDSIRYRVWLPERFDKNAKHTAIYTVEDTEDGILFGCASFAMKQKSIPGTIVVGIISGRKLIDFNFLTGKPNPKGMTFLKEWTTRIIPDVEKEFGASVYKAFMGHSYSAVYGNYLMLHHPGLFKGYILFAPERYWNDETKPVYSISDSIARYYNNNKAFVYLAVGAEDIKRRKDYVSEIADKVKILDSTRFIFKSEIAAGSHHMSIVPNKMEAALWHIFNSVTNFQDRDSVVNALEYFNEVQKDLNDVFGIDIPKYPETSWYFYKLAAKNRDEKAFNTFSNYFPFQKMLGGAGLDYCNIASVCLAEGWKSKAEALYQQAIKQAAEDEQTKPAVQNQYNIEMASRNLAFKIYTADPDKAWNILLHAAKTIKYIGNYFNAGRFGVEKKLHLEAGISYLKKCLDMKDSEEFIQYEERIYQYLAQGYFLQDNKKKALEFAEKTVALNPGNDPARYILFKYGKAPG
ncbi:alpha/beta hydrolase-fold protein [Niabella beijingensis]|uniref:alpha/beta hydrolase-fold protein n=1 Tax=Niabella beijingensis TaxID=2872700 RepID=UPI001CBBDF71|nr:alpha/beta hydrolase-fold protein [Niabella beijingensis]MBZ4191130.1 esterase family protein [Niabella beijingensis]